MNQIDIGKLIAKARKEKGYTQQELANLLFVTDKAVSKWERGLSLPDSNVYTKVAHLLDLDVEDLLPTNSVTRWVGYIKLDETNNLYKEKLGTQTVFEHLMSLFALLSINEVYVDCDDVEFVKSLKLQKYGFNLYLNSSVPTKKVVCLTGNFLLYGANLTRWFRTLMSLDVNVNFIHKNIQTPIYIKAGETSITKNIGRGYVYSLIDDKNFNLLNSLLNNLSSVVGYQINNLSEIIELRKKVNF